jgi:hypothetical protein
MRANLNGWRTREVLAQKITAQFFPVSPRTLERWPIAVKHVARRALHKEDEVLAFALRRLEQAPVTRQSAVRPMPKSKGVAVEATPPMKLLQAGTASTPTEPGKGPTDVGRS